MIVLNYLSVSNTSMLAGCSMILDETSQHVLSVPPQSSLPVVVAEILTMSESKKFTLKTKFWFKFLFCLSILDPSDVSVLMSPNGWAWLVFGRRLVLWRYQPAFSGKGQSGASQRSLASCRELTLPPSDLAHNARLVNVVTTGNNMTPACIAVSPEGKFGNLFTWKF